ncbi:cytochrome b [Thermomonas fusca]|uniref:Cytochrome b n=1 Tax=Thermomonas fusca TaxID=215690 RepID=A0A5R9PIZ5_9GAMM|nr:cytochrome b/b6 domain-containing protein [Thermomonas fusca]TLX23196.1 cytochrome b [Thermomonas fusca]
MPKTAPRSDWPALSKVLHWLIALLILAMAWLGLTMGEMPNGPDKIATYALHKSIGLSILALVALRLLWRLYAGAPATLAGTPRWQERIAALTHLALYALLLALPLSGWLLNSAAGFPLQWFGVFNLPALAGRDEALHELAEQTHELLFWALAGLVVLHAAAALHHHLFLGDATLARMLPRGWLRAGAHAKPENPDA